MKLAIVFLLFAFATMAVNGLMDFDKFTKHYKKSYANEGERQKRMQKFQKNVKSIEEFNKHSSDSWSAKFDVTPFTDLDTDEFVSTHMGYKPRSVKTFQAKAVNNTDTIKLAVTATDSYDWSQMSGYVLPPKDQGNCGSCWAFATVAILETYYVRKGKPLISLSEQQLVDCSTANSGCNGGSPYYALAYEKSKGAESGSVYPYTGYDQSCRYSSSKVLVKPLSYTSISDETQMMTILKNYGPIAVSIYADPLQNYRSGIMTLSQCPNYTPNHAVTLVGYGTQNGIPYWKFKNSWGTQWGENGYFRLKRNSNVCNMRSDAVYIVS